MCNKCPAADANPFDLDDSLEGLFDESAPVATSSTPREYRTQGGNVLPESGIVLPSAPVRRPFGISESAVSVGNGQFKEPCGKCRNGTFYSWSGRPLGSCHACNGLGYRIFKNDRATRTVNKQKAAARKATKQEAARVDFATSHPVAAAWIAESSATGFNFAVAMRDALARFGTLTPNQLAACERMAAKLSEAKATRAAAQAVREESAAVVNTDKLESAFATARAAGLSRLKFRVAQFTISPAKESSANAGALYVKSGDSYLGKVKGGKFYPVRECTAETESAFLAVMADPMAAAKAYGIKTGRCSCCGAELTNKESIAAGIGPICASNWGL